jgi:hypothetical protein
VQSAERRTETPCQSTAEAAGATVTKGQVLGRAEPDASGDAGRGPDIVSEAEIDTWMRLYADDPYIVNLLATGDPRPYRTSDFMTFNRFRQTLVYREVCAQFEMHHLLVMTPRTTEQDLVLIGLTRRIHDFTDRETRALHPLRDLIAAALETG